jgi:UPF0176 protein
MSVNIAAFYHFHPLPDFRARKRSLLAFMEKREMRGSILLASEGVNGTISGRDAAVRETLEHLRSWPGFSALSAKFSAHREHPFGRAKVRLKKELISLGEHADPGEGAGIIVPPEIWNALISAPDVVTIDARNAYEFRLGHFQGATDPNTRSFRQITEFTRAALDPVRTPKIATYCTGGIRCEKYTAWLRNRGFAEVYQLEGGILNYLEHVPKEESLWNGACYVFDERIAVGHDLEAAPGLSACLGCGHPLTEAERCCPVCAYAN